MQNNLRKRDNRYYFRRRIPLDLVEHYGKQELCYSLRTSDYALAKVLASAETTKTDAEFLKIRASRQPSMGIVQAADAATLDAFNAREEWFAEYRANREYHREIDARIRQATAVQEATGQLQSAPIPLYPHEAGKSRADAPSETLRDIVPSWITRSGPGEDAKKRTNRALDLFEEAVGCLPVRDLKKAHGAAFVRFLLDAEKRGFSAKTAGNHAAAINALMNIAVKDDLIEVNPFDLSFDKTRDSEERGPWTDDELSLMYGSVLFSDAMETVPHWHKITPTDMRGLLLILQHSGARIGEIAQLRRGDFLTQSGIKAMRITDEAGTVKTDESRRVVPLADHLLSDPWFAQWLAGIMGGSDKEKPAFPSLHGRQKVPGERAVQWFKEFRDAIGLPPGPLNGSHRFRHWIRTALNALDVADATQDAITGHAVGGSTGKRVYTSVPLHVMRAALDRVTYPKVTAG